MRLPETLRKSLPAPEALLITRLRAIEVLSIWPVCLRTISKEEQEIFKIDSAGIEFDLTVAFDNGTACRNLFQPLVRVYCGCGGSGCWDGRGAAGTEAFCCGQAATSGSAAMEIKHENYLLQAVRVFIKNHENAFNKMSLLR